LLFARTAGTVAALSGSHYHGNTKEKSMTRLCSLTLCAAFGTGLFACGSNGTDNGANGGTKTALQLAPGDNTVSGWKVDKDANKNPDAQPMTGATKKEVEGLIDGAASPFFIDPNIPKMFVWQNYTNTTLPAAPDGAEIVMYILEMPSADQAAGLYSAVLKLSEYARKQGTDDDWKTTDPLLGAESRIQNTSSQWWVNFHKGVFYVEVSMTPSTGPAPDYTPGNADTKKAAISFAKAIADQI
jgi:hypothetical protein